MSEHRPFVGEAPSPCDREPRPRFDLSTIMGIKVDDVKLSDEITQMADQYLEQLSKEGANQAQLAELAYAFRRQLQTDLLAVRDKKKPKEVSETETEEDEEEGSLAKRLRTKLLKTDESHAFSLAVYRKLLESASGTIQIELARHEQERKKINGNYETYKSLRGDLESMRKNHHELLARMFKLAGREASPAYLAKRAILEASIADIQSDLDKLKKEKPDVAALVEYDTLNEYAAQLRDEGFIWTPSRRKLLDDILKASLTNRPVIALMGETGSGKTAIVRAASRILSGREPERAVGGNKESFARLLASPAISEGKTYYEYGPILRAMTGKTSSIDTNPSNKGHIFFDDEFNTRPTSVQREIQKFLSEARVGRQVSIPGTPFTEMVLSGFLVFLAGNPASERYDREETGIETKREFAGNVLNVGYLEQTAENPELYQVLLASLMDRSTGRLIAVTPGEVAPEWNKADAVTGESLLNIDPTSGAFLWRFSNAWGELFKAFSHQDTVLHTKNPSEPKAKYHLPTFILDPGVVLIWMDRYKASPKDRNGHLANFVLDNFSKYLLQFPEEEQRIVGAYLDHFGIALSVPEGDRSKESAKSKRLREIHELESSKPTARVLTPKEIGYLNPNVPRAIEKRDIPPTDMISPLLDENGDEIGSYVRISVLGIEPGTSLALRSGLTDMTTPKRITLLGVSYDKISNTMNQKVVLFRDENSRIQNCDLESFKYLYFPELPPPPPSEKGELRPFAYDSAKAREYGFSEMKIEAHPEAQKIVDAIYARDSRFVTTHKAGSPDPDSTTTPPDVLTADKYKLNEVALKQAWNQNCSNLPNVPEKSLWYFQALAEHRLSSTIDGDDPNNLTNPTKPLIPDFGQKSFLLAMDFKEFDYDNATEKAYALTPQTKKILQTLFDTDDPTNIKRDEVNTALWSDHEKRIQSDKAKQVIRELLGSSTNPDDYELRLMRTDEYERAATSQGYGQKNLWTHMDGYYARDDGYRNGLVGGRRAHGGAANVDDDHRDNRSQALAVRLVLSRKSPELPPPPPPPEKGELRPFNYDVVKAREYGFSEMKIEAHPEAQKIVDAIYNHDSRFVTIHKAGSPDPDSTATPPSALTADKYKINEAALKQAWNQNCSNLPNVPEKSLWKFQALAEHRLSNTIDGDDPNNLDSPTIPHIPGFGRKSFMLAMDFKEFDYDNATEKANALTPQTKKILQTLFGKDDPTGIERNTVNTALWNDHEKRIQSDKAKQVIRELLGSSTNPDDYELRLLRPDEYERAATSQGYGQKNLWTHMDGYYARDGGYRTGLFGGRRDGGGAASVDDDPRDARLQSLAVRLVLSRKNPEVLPRQEIANVQEAKDILGADNVYGPEAVKATWDRDLAPHEIPPIPYSREQLESAKKMNMMLVLRVDKDKDGKPLTGKRMNEIIQPKLTATNNGKLLFDVSWYASESFYTTTTPKFEWKLVTRDLLPNSTNLDYADQTKLLRDTLAQQPDLTQAEQEAIVEATDAVFADLKAKALDDSTWEQSASALKALKINVNHRRRFADVVFDHATLLETQNKRLFGGQNIRDWTNDQTSGGSLVGAGDAGSVGVLVSRWGPRNQDGDLGVSFSR